MDGWTLPQALDVNGVRREINADFRDILDIIDRMNDVEEDETVRGYVCLALFYKDFDSIPSSDYQDAVNQMTRFISCGEEPAGDKRPKTIDWEQDRSLIIADINKTAGCEVRALKFCHWWTFMAWFNSIGEGQLSTVVSIREKKRKGKKLSEWEREFYKANRARVDFKMKYTAAEKEELRRWIAQ